MYMLRERRILIKHIAKSFYKNRYKCNDFFFPIDSINLMSMQPPFTHTCDNSVIYDQMYFISVVNHLKKKIVYDTGLDSYISILY